MQNKTSCEDKIPCALASVNQTLTTKKHIQETLHQKNPGLSVLLLGEIAFLQVLVVLSSFCHLWKLFRHQQKQINLVLTLETHSRLIKNPGIET